ncbi:hypothetical protein FHU10_5306 [Serratia fonticola]|uniref:Uncharacterized protein n=1 Tax=Serratia fonticola TaxID=47917 RepID=A0A542CRX8_SERFO|nr:hypothetical protein [Serratia fonticola]TQI77295.1 hypothetical protein FHU09_5292 [Serratia fonticola]TQI93579.1 hypothetical protein FHU11_5272 [Serratia fonticola]TVZ61608.1 hypothetical protein FHU10_5306 [Serratia fonticola]
MNRFPEAVSFLYPVQLEPCPPEDSETTLPSLNLKAPEAKVFCQWIFPLVPEFYHCGVSADASYDCNVWLIPLALLTEQLKKLTPELSDSTTKLLTKACRRWSRHNVTHLRLTAAIRYQHFDIEQQVWGHEQTGQDPALRRRAAKLTGNACEYCEHFSASNLLTFRDSNPENTNDCNLTVACSVCLCSRRLNRLSANDGVMVYLPELAPADISRLIRTVVAARRDGDERQQNGAAMILNWLTAHRTETERFWGTSHPGEFGQALQQSSPALRESLQQRLRHIALIPNPDIIAARSFSLSLPPGQWTPLYNQYCRHP